MSDRALDAWCVEFDLLSAEAGDLLPYGVAEELMVGVVLPWARARGYEVGGGFREAGEMWRPRVGQWRYKFSVATDVDRLIPEAQAGSLLSVIEAFAMDHGARVEGGYREFTDEDWPPQENPDIEHDTEADEKPGDL